MVWWPKMGSPKFWIFKNVQFRHICGAFEFWSNFGWPKIWVIPCWSPHLIVRDCYPWLIMVINSNNTVSKAFWQKKVLPEQRISCCGVIYNERNIDQNVQVYTKIRLNSLISLKYLKNAWLQSTIFWVRCIYFPYTCFIDSSRNFRFLTNPFAQYKQYFNFTKCWFVTKWVYQSWRNFTKILLL